jgi:iron-sulfur cluster assembly protein
MVSAESNIITVTEKALARLASIREEGKALRIAVVGGGCSGMSYKLSWVTLGETTLADKSEIHGEISVVIDPKSALFLRGITLDYSDGLNGQGFEFNNPNAKRSCGCGSSFST